MKSNFTGTLRNERNSQKRTADMSDNTARGNKQYIWAKEGRLKRSHEWFIHPKCNMTLKNKERNVYRQFGDNRKKYRTNKAIFE